MPKWLGQGTQTRDDSLGMKRARVRVNLHLSKSRTVCSERASHVAVEHRTVADRKRNQSGEARYPIWEVGSGQIETLKRDDAYTLVLLVCRGSDTICHHVGNFDDDGLEIECPAPTPPNLKAVEWGAEEAGFEFGVVAGQVLELREEVAEPQGLDPAAIWEERSAET